MNNSKFYEQYWLGTNGWNPASLSAEMQLGKILEARIRAGMCVLDVGCGNGSGYVRAVRAIAGRVYGIELSRVAGVVAQENGLDVVTADLSQPFPYNSNTCDVVICVEVLEHLMHPEAAVREMLRVLRPGGMLIVTVPNFAQWQQRVRLLFGRFVGGGSPATIRTPWRDPHIRFFTRDSLRSMLKGSGARIHSIDGQGVALLASIPGVSSVLARYLGWNRLHSWSHYFERLARYRPTIFAGTLIAVASKPQSVG